MELNCFVLQEVIRAKDTNLQGWSRYVWASAGKQPALEQAVGVGGYGYPAMVALNVKKSVFAPMRSAFEVDPIT